MGSASSSASSNQNIMGMGRLSEDRKIYRLVDLHGGGELIPWLRYALTSNDHSFIDAYVDTKVREFLYNQGKGKLVTVTELVKLRNKERNERLGAFSRKKGKGKSGPNVLDDFNQENENAGDLKKALKLLDGGGKGGKNESKYREIAWKLEERGSMGETIVGICLLQATEIHNKLGLKILEAYPKLVNDIHISEDYYGLSPLHQAIINQDPRMAYTLLKMGADVNARCYGAFFCANDQRHSRTDSLEHEYVELSIKTNYTGNMYFGEYPLSFASCLNQRELYRLLLNFKANPNLQDSNGNTTLHMCVIHENWEMFKLALETGASLRIANKQNLTPLTLAAKLAKKKLFLEILELEGDSVWAYGGASSTAYPLAKIDTINETTGEMNDSSALSLVVYGDSVEHLELLDGILDTVLEAKWEAFAKRQMVWSVAWFVIYYGLVVGSFMFRPYSWSTELATDGWINRQGQVNINQTFPKLDNTSKPEEAYAIIKIDNGDPIRYDPKSDQCHLLNYFEPDLEWTAGYLRMGLDICILLGVMIQMMLDVRDIRRIGRKKWLNILKAFPAKILFKITYFLVIAIVPLRFSCKINPWSVAIDNGISCAIVVLTTIHFLFFLRVIRFVGPFVLMIYTIIASDIVRFGLIYSIFLVGFSQAFSLVFLSCERKRDIILKNQTLFSPQEVELANNFVNIIQNPAEAFVRTFIMTIGEFTTLYRNLAMCPSNIMIYIGKAVFVIFELFVSILQFNMLIAMMTRTYEMIAKTQKEYKRQRAQVILMLELSLSPKDRLNYLLQYSRPIGTNKKTRSLIVNRKVQRTAITEEEMAAKAEKAKQMLEERKALLRKKQKGTDKDGRPITGYGSRAANGRPNTSFLKLKDIS
ncbi:hypothetical protein WR25_19679 [Diploscapter pachys]|uniref:Ion transport domain-containing protein n=1 Tax=Diploscapter pachys TaxID=2018661 RepID=A0A2A2JVW3_9BILA|nr:hypothetical protein WR25_19679 [Diploscapter pachys]